MLKHYFVLAIKVLLRRPFFTFISLFGISVTLLVLMVATAMFDHSFAPAPPETRQDRMLGVFYATMYGEHSTWSGDAGYKLLDRYARNLPGVEQLSIFESGDSAPAYIGGEKVSLSLKRTDGEYWKILEFTFLEGRPYSTSDVDAAQHVAVINDATREKFFGRGRSAVGQTIEVDGQSFQVVGVVENISRVRQVSYSDIWVPHTTSKNTSYRDEMMGGYNAIVLATSRSELPKIREEFNARLARAELPDPRQYKSIVAPFETRFENFARNSPAGDRKDPASQGWKAALFLGLLAFLFMLLPTVNLININVSRIMERSSEIGVRKAFGASSRALIGQFIVENILLTLVGGLIGFVLSALVLRALNASGMVEHAQFGLNVRIFGWGLLITLIFGLMSGVYPAWRMSRLHPVDALKGGATR
jgi:putative ABC transport system permease protein